MNYFEMTQEGKLLIDRYLENSLTGLELKEFLDNLESDERFRKEVSFHNILIEGIQYAEDKRHIAFIEEFIGYRKPIVPFALKLIFTFLVITTGGIVIWNYIDPDSTGKKHNYFSLDFFRKANEDKTGTLVAENGTPKNKKIEQKFFTNQADSSNYTEDNALVETNILNQSDNTEIVVKKDQLLVNITLKSIDINGQNSKEDNPESSIAKNTADKLNPSGGLPESENKKTENYNVEFWVSPVNYKGYKLIHDKLILFGIEEPDAVQLYSKENMLWMKYGQDFYTLEPSDDFESLIKLTEIPSALK